MTKQPIKEFCMSEPEIISYLAGCYKRGLVQFEHGIQAILMSHPFTSEKKLREKLQTYLKQEKI